MSAAARAPRDELGAHMSVAGGLELAIARGAALGCGAVQIFVKSQRRWTAPPLTDAEAERFRRARRGSGIRWLFAHGSYLLNLASPGHGGWRMSLDALTDELERAEALGLGCVVIHPGSHLGEGLAPGLARVTAALDEACRRTAGYRVRIALENTAGGGATIGRTFGELAELLARARTPERLGVCIDTCHLFVSGYDIRTPAGYARAMDECVATMGRRAVLAFHLNDARAALASGLDRHQHIGRGRLGLAPFRLLLNDARWRRVPKVLETPKEPEPRADRRNLAMLRALRTVGQGLAVRATRPARGRRRSRIMRSSGKW